MTARVSILAGSRRPCDLIAVRAGRVLATVLLAGVVSACVGVPVGVAKPVTIASGGSGAGQVQYPLSVAVNQASGAVYVTDELNFRVDEFGSGNEFVLAWGYSVVNAAEELQFCTIVTGCREGGFNFFGEELKAGTGVPVGALGRAYGAAVDQSSGDVWVSTAVEQDRRVTKFGPSGEPLLALGREINRTKVELHKAQEAKKEPVTVTPAEEDLCTVPSGNTCQNAPAGTAVGQFLEPGGPLAVDASGDVWVGDRERIEEFDSSGAYKASVALPGLGETKELAVAPSGADVYVVSEGAAGVREYETASGLPVGSPIDETGAPEAIALDGAENVYVGGGSPYSFKEYTPAGVQVEQFGTGQVIGGPGYVPGFPKVEGGVDGIAVDGGAGALYAAGGFASYDVQRFPLPERVGAPLPVGESASPVATTATIRASLDPENHATTYRFEYGSEPGVYTQSTATETLPGTGFAAETVQASLAGLSPSTTYYYRLSATNHCNTEKPAEECTVHGEGASFTTQRAIAVESESALGVSSDAASLEGVLNPLGVQAQWWVEYGTVEGVFDHSTVRESLAAGSVGVSVGVHVQGLEPGTVYHYRFAASDEREGHPYTSYGESLSFKTQPALVSSSLLDGRAWEMVSPLDKQGASFAAPGGGDAPLEQAAVDGSAVTYGATASIEGAPPGEPSGSGLWVQVLSRHAGDGWSSRDMASPHEEEWGFETGYSNEFAWFSSDLSLAIVSPEGNTLLGGASERTPYLRRQALCEDSARAAECYLPLVNTGNVTSGEKWGGSTENKVEGEVKAAASPSDSSHLVLVSKVPLLAGTSGPGVYEWSAGRLVLVSVLPGEAPMPAGCVPQTNAGQHSVSTNADRIFWETSCQGPGGAGAEHHLYMREAAGARTVQLDVGVVGNEANFQDASSDASRVFFWDGAYTAPPDLYVYEANADSDPEAGVVQDLTVPVHAGESADVVGIPGASPDGSVVYALAMGVLTETPNQHGQVAQTGQVNLYRVQRVEAAGKVGWQPSFIATVSSGDQFVASADGSWLAFTSSHSLTGYDNRDASTGQRDAEVFLYHAPGEGAGEGPGTLVCVSCDPTGVRPQGPSALQVGGGANRTRDLSDSGRLFFETADALVPQDVNATVDVYEYEPPGVGSCTSGSATIAAGQDGCLGLVSSGISSEASRFLDASESGNDVFFLTTGKLVAQDTDDAKDVYDAHVCGSGWECLAPPAVSPPCSNTSSCRGASEPQPVVFGAAGSATFSGTGNLPPSPLVTRPVKRAKVRCVKHRRLVHGRCARAKAKTGKKAKGSRSAGRARRAGGERRTGR